MSEELLIHIPLRRIEVLQARLDMLHAALLALGHDALAFQVVRAMRECFAKFEEVPS